MIDLSEAILAKSDQLNADDLIGNDRIIKIEDVKTKKSNGRVDVSIYYEGCNNRPYKPSTGMVRVMVHGWGKDGSSYIGRYLKLFREPSVIYGGKAVGGIRIASMSDIKSTFVFALTITRGKKEPIKIGVLSPEECGTKIVRSLAESKLDCIEALKSNGIDLSDDDLEEIESCEDKKDLANIYNNMKKKVDG